MMDRVVEQAFQYVQNTVAIHLATTFNDDCDRIPFDSPLERIFWLWWRAIMLCRRVEGIPDTFRLVPQYWVTAQGQRYRLDFIVEDSSRPDWKLAIELDGHAFHERTREQVIQRNQRDRDLQAEGWTVLHFSGSEFFSNPYQCLREVFDQVLG